MKKTKLPKRLTALVLVFAMMSGLLAGCASDPAADTAPTTEPVQPLRWSGHISGEVMKDQPEAKGLQPVVSRAPDGPASSSYTLMVYMIGSDLESLYGCASSDILEMLNSGLDPSKCNLLIYTGGANSWDLNIPSAYNAVYAMNSSGTGLDMVASTSQPANMGEASTFLDFICYAYNYYPASHYGLICWDHGGGPLYGYGSDELFEQDGLSLAEMQSAMMESPFYGGLEKLDFIGFDACLMASLEVASVFSDFARYMIASEEIEAGSGWDYSFLRTFNDTADTESIARSILDSYAASMEANIWMPDYTLSCIDLSGIMAVEMFLCTTLNYMTWELENGSYSSIAQARDRTKRFGMSSVSSSADSLDLVDIGHLAENLYGQYSGAPEYLKKWLDEAVVYETSNVENTHGLSFYFPYDNKMLFQYAGDMFYSLFTEFDGYEEFMTAFSSAWLTGRSSIRWNPDQKIESQEEYLTLQLEPAQLENINAITYSILQYDETNETYSAIVTNLRAEYDEKGIVQIPKNPDVFLMVTDVDRQLGQEGTVWPVMLAESGAERSSYVSVNSLLLSSADLLIGGRENVQISLTDHHATGEVSIQSILARDEESYDLMGKRDVSIDNWGIVSYMWEPLFPTYDMDGRMLPWDQWETDGSVWYSLCNYEETFSMEKASLSKMDGTFYCQVVMEDTYGNIIDTRLEPIREAEAYRTQTLATAGGNMTFHIYSDHAELYTFEETDGITEPYSITVPAAVGGVPVTLVCPEAFYVSWNLGQVTLPDTITEIGYSAFGLCGSLTSINIPANVRILGNSVFSNTALTEIQLPEGLEMIGYNCFAYSDLTSIRLPASVNLVGSGAFAGCSALSAITVAEGNAAYQAVDGVLFTADGKKLVAYPGGAGASYSVPAGVEIIGDGAFRNLTALTNVTFPEGLKVIDRLAFCDTTALASIDLPDSLEVIGNGAFAGSLASRMGDNGFAVEIGGNVSYVGFDAFSGYRITQFHVSENNLNYAAANGCLLNKSGTRLIQAPYGLEGKLEVPSGVGYIGWHAFNNCTGITELVFPDSVVAVSHASYVPENLKKLTVGSGMTDWQGLNQYIDVAEIILSGDNPNYTLHEGSIYSKDMTRLLLCRSIAGQFEIPEGVVQIAEHAFPSPNTGFSALTQITIPASVQTIPEGAFSALGALESFEIASGSSDFSVYDGLLYSADGATLVACPMGRTGTIQVREGTVEIGSKAFYFGSSMKADTVIIPEGVTVIRYGNFTSTPYGSLLQLYLPASVTDIHPDMFEYANEVEVHCPAGSAADTFAREIGIKVINN
ncbi:MAG: leucine-rich repeat protein [Oscillospiraceae bacterium]|nr:leucine-rich repeat protein [Oscillospiraceae bacterium]